MMIHFVPIILDYFYCIMQLDQLSYDWDRNYLSTSTFIRRLYKNLKSFLKNNEEKTTFQ